MALHDVWLGWLKWQILTGIQPPQLLRSVTWRVHTWRMFSLLPDNHSGTILLGPYTRKPIFALLPTLLSKILHVFSGCDPDLMKIHRNKVYLLDHIHTSHDSSDTILMTQAPNILTGEFAISNFQLWTQKQHLMGIATFGKLNLTSGKLRRPRSHKEFSSYHPHEASNLFAEMNTFFQIKNPHEWMAMG